MQIMGKTEIELKDIRTGKTETVVEKNMITNAIADLFSHNIEGMLFNMAGYTGDMNGNLIPLSMNAIGGILLFSEAIPEEAGNYYALSANPCVGYASNDVNATANVMRGSLNLTESQKLDDGYKFVWDFTTSQANGTISAVALTHKFGGIGYMGDPYNNTSKVWHMKSLSTSADAAVRTAYTNAVEVNFEGNFFYTIGINVSNELIVRKVKASYRSIGINDTLRENNLTVLEEHILTPTVFIMEHPSNNNGNYEFMDGKNGYWYGIWHDANSNGDAVIKWIKIKKSDYSFSEGTWTIDNVTLQSAGYHSGYDTGPGRSAQCVIRNGYLYMISYDKRSVYKINVDNQADVTKIDLGFTSQFGYSNDYYNNGAFHMVLIGDWIVCSDFRIDTQDRVYQTANAMPYPYSCTPLFQYGPYLFSYGGYNSGDARKNIFLLTPYLASINNLSTAVIKTADKTMKITYTVTETE